MPQTSLMGSGCLSDAGEQIKTLGFRKALIVTDKVLNIDVKLVESLTAVLKKNGVDYSVFDDTKPNPTETNVNDGLKNAEK
jgi:alcohol dehydrogenase